MGPRLARKANLRRMRRPHCPHSNWPLPHPVPAPRSEDLTASEPTARLPNSLEGSPRWPPEPARPKLATRWQRQPTPVASSATSPLLPEAASRLIPPHCAVFAHNSIHPFAMNRAAPPVWHRAISCRDLARQRYTNRPTPAASDRHPGSQREIAGTRVTKMSTATEPATYGHTRLRAARGLTEARRLLT